MQYTLTDHPLHQAIYDLCQEIEKLPPSEHATKLVVMAGALQQPVAQLRAENARLQMELDASCNAEELRQVREALAEAREDTARWRSASEKLADALRLNRNALYCENEYARMIKGNHPTDPPPFDYAIEPADVALSEYDAARAGGNQS